MARLLILPPRLLTLLGKVGGSAGSIALRGLSIISNIVAVSLALRLLGPERYGQYVLLIAASGWLALGMLGTGEHFTKALVKVPGGGSAPEALPLIRATFAYCLIGAAGVIAVSIAGLWALAMFDMADGPLLVAGAILLIGTSASLPLSMASSALIAQGRIGYDAVFKLLQPLSLLGMVALAYIWPPASPGTMLVFLSAAYALSWLLTRGGAFLSTFPLRPLFQRLSEVQIGSVARGAWPFLVIQVAALLSFQTDRFLVSSFSTLSDLASYDLLFRIFGALYAVFSIPLLHIWRLVGTSWHEGDMQRVHRITRLYSAGAALFWSGVTLAVMIAAPLIIRIFSGGSVAALPWLVTVLIGAFFLVRGTTDVLTLSLYAMGQEKALLPFVIAHGVTNVAFAATGGAIAGIEGLLIGQIISFVASTQLPFMVILKRRTTRAIDS